METIYSQIEVKRYFQYQYGIYVANFYDKNGVIKKSCFSIKGKSIYPLMEGRCYKLVGEYKYDQKYGAYFEFNQVYEIDIIGDKQMFDFYERYNNQSQSTYQSSKANIYTALRERIEDDEKVEELVSYGVDFLKAQTLVDKDSGIFDTIKKDPYILIELDEKFSFKECDIIAAKLKINPEDSYRIRTAIREVAKSICNASGNTFVINTSDLRNKVKQMLCYNLTKENIEKILEESKKTGNSLIDFDVYGFFFNTVDVKELKKCISTNQEYLFYEMDEKLIEKEFLCSDRKITIYGDKIYLTEIYNAEKYIANKIKTLLNNKKGTNNINTIRKKIFEYENKNNISFTKEQIESIEKILTPQSGGFFILTGAAGTGKTTVIDAVLHINSTFKRPLMPVIGAPTGKAVKVLKDSINCLYTRTETIHRLLEYVPNNENAFAYCFRRNELNPLYEDFVIIDETSMLDTELASYLLKAIRDDAKVVFIGDPHQLPSIGPGSVLKDLLTCIGSANVLTLSKICRQANGSGIIENSNNILAGNDISTSTDKNNFVIDAKNSEIFKHRLNQGLEFLLKSNINKEDIIVLSPMKIGSLGTYALNKILQEKFNPNGLIPEEIKEMPFKGCEPNTFKVGDKVICVKNNYFIFKYGQPIDRSNVVSYVEHCTRTFMEATNNIKYDKVRAMGVANGEDGIITDIFSAILPLYDFKGRFRGFEKKSCITVKFDDGYVCFWNTADLRLGYAISIHKSQGSGWKGVISIMNKQQEKMACNELFYVANTRAKEKNVFLIDKDVYNDNVLFFSNNRQTTLVDIYENI